MLWEIVPTVSLARRSVTFALMWRFPAVAAYIPTALAIAGKEHAAEQRQRLRPEYWQEDRYEFEPRSWPEESL